MAGMERFTQRARRVLSLAHQEAERMRHTAINTEHILLGLIEEEGGIAGHALRELGLETTRVQEMVERLAPIGRVESPALELSVGAQQVLEYAIEEARLLGHQFVGTEHLLLGLTRSTEGMALEVLRKLGVTPEQVRRQTRRVMEDSASGPTSAGHAPLARRDEKKEAKTPLVDQLAVDLTVLAEEGKLDPVIGRQQEIERVIQILARRNKNNPALIGEPGVGKTAIVEGLAQRIIEGDVPAPLIGKKVLQLDVGSLVAGTMYRGQFEERLKRVIDELKASKSILFIDELHMLVGAGAALWGLHMGATQGLLSALVADAAPADLRGTAFGVFILVTGVALLAASVIAGWLWTVFGPAATFHASAALATAALVGLLARPRT